MKRATDIPRLPKEVVLDAANLTSPEARFLVADYYLMQDMRKRADMQIRHLGDKALPTLLKYTADASAVIEGQVKKALKSFAEAHPVGRWMMAQDGCAEVIASGLLAHLWVEHPLQQREKIKYPDKNIGEMVPTEVVGHWWRLAGLDPTVKWEAGKKRPWNADLKQICWHAGQCFKRVSGKGRLATAPQDGRWIELEVRKDDWRKAKWNGNTWIEAGSGKTLTPEKVTAAEDAAEHAAATAATAADDDDGEKKKKWRPGWRLVGGGTPSYYGSLYRWHKARVTIHNDSGGNVERAKNFVTKSAEVRKTLAEGKLPANNLDAQACRFAVKIFLSHLHAVWFFHHFGRPAPKPFAIAILGHADELRVPKAAMFPGFAEASYPEGAPRELPIEVIGTETRRLMPKAELADA